MRAIIGARGARRLLVGVLILVLGACSSIRLAYNNAPELAYFWLDRYVDFDKAQGKRVSAELEQLLRWHRSEELPLIADLLQSAQTLALQTPSGPQLCALNQAVLQRSEAIGLHAVPAAAAIVTTLSSQQLANLAKAYEKSNRKMREEWRSAQAQGMDNRTFKSLERLEDLYGSLSSAQRRLFQDAMATTGFDSTRYLEEVQSRQQITLQTLENCVMPTLPRHKRRWWLGSRCFPSRPTRRTASTTPRSPRKPARLLPRCMPKPAWPNAGTWPTI